MECKLCKRYIKQSEDWFDIGKIPPQNKRDMRTIFTLESSKILYTKPRHKHKFYCINCARRMILTEHTYCIRYKDSPTTYELQDKISKIK